MTNFIRKAISSWNEISIGVNKLVFSPSLVRFNVLTNPAVNATTSKGFQLWMRIYLVRHRCLQIQLPPIVLHIPVHFIFYHF